MVNPPGLEPGSTGCQNMHSGRHAKQPCSMAWQSEHTLICSDDHIITHAPLRFTHTGIPCAFQRPYSSHPERPTHKCFTHLWGPSHRGQPTWGSLTQFYGHSSDDLTASHTTSDTICSEGRAWSPHPDSNPGLQGAKHAL